MIKFRNWSSFGRQFDWECAETLDFRWQIRFWKLTEDSFWAYLMIWLVYLTRERSLGFWWRLDNHQRKRDEYLWEYDWLMKSRTSQSSHQFSRFMMTQWGFLKEYRDHDGLSTRDWNGGRFREITHTNSHRVWILKWSMWLKGHRSFELFWIDTTNMHTLHHGELFNGYVLIIAPTW